MKKNLFIIKKIVAMVSNQDDKITTKHSKFKGLNIRVTLNKVIDAHVGIIQDLDEYLNIGNTNVGACESFDKFVSGFEKSKQTNKDGNPYVRVSIISNELINGSMFELEYRTKTVGSSEFIIPVSEAKYKGYINLNKIVKTSSTPLF